MTGSQRVGGAGHWAQQISQVCARGSGSAGSGGHFAPCPGHRSRAERSPLVVIAATMGALAVLRLFATALLVTCTVPLETASRFMPPGRSHRQKGED